METNRVARDGEPSRGSKRTFSPFTLPQFVSGRRAPLFNAEGVIHTTIQDNVAQGGTQMSPRLPLQIPSGRVHVYFVAPSVKTNEGRVERTSIYYTDASGTKFKFMAKDPLIRQDLIQLGQRADLSEVDEEFLWAKGGALTIRVVPRAQ